MKLELLRTYFATGTNGILLYNEAPCVQRLSCPGKITVPVFRVALRVRTP